MNPTKATNREKVLAEQYDKQTRTIVIVDKFTPDVKTQAVTGKFYSRADWVNFKDVNQEWLDLIEFKESFTPKMKYPRPVTENQRYGWFTKPLIVHDRNDRRRYCPLVPNPATKFESKLQADKSMERPRFTGIPFKLL